MDWKIIRLIWTLELRTLLRSRRTLILSVLLPLLVMPLMLLATRFSADLEKRQQTSADYQYAISGDWIDQTRMLIDSAAIAIGNDADSELREFRYAERTAAEPASSVRSGALDFYLETFSPESADLEWNQIETQNRSFDLTSHWLQHRIEGVPAVRIMTPGNRSTSAAGAARMADLLDYARRVEAERALGRLGFSLQLENLLPLSDFNIASDAQGSGLLVGRLLTLFLFSLTLAGGSVVAMDIIAGEKERGTLETLLTTAAGRREIMAAKQLVILSSALVITLAQIANLIVYTRLDMLPLPDTFRFQLSLEAAAAILLMYLSLAVLIAGALLLISAHSKSYKEAQLYFFPVYIVGMFLAAAGAIGEIPLRSAVALIPLSNISVAVREVLSGHLDWWLILAIVAVNSITAVWVLRYSTSLLGDERLISAKQEQHPDRLHGLQAFRSHLWRWYALMWVILFVGGSVLPALSDFRVQALFNEVIVLLGGSLLILRVYRLNAQRALALRRVRFKLWPILLLLIGPLHLTAVFVNRIATTVFPVPQSYLDQLDAQIPFDGVPFWQIFVLFAVLPGVCEEVSFRGPLLYGLRRRFSLPVLTVVVGLIFGFFHFSIFRIVTTGILGIVITAIALMTGSIFPGIVLHIGNNALAFALARHDIPIDELPVLLYGLGVASTLALIWIVYRNRAPYPQE